MQKLYTLPVNVLEQNSDLKIRGILNWLGVLIIYWWDNLDLYVKIRLGIIIWFK